MWGGGPDPVRTVCDCVEAVTGSGWAGDIVPAPGCSQPRVGGRGQRHRVRVGRVLSLPAVLPCACGQQQHLVRSPTALWAQHVTQQCLPLCKASPCSHPATTIMRMESYHNLAQALHISPAGHAEHTRTNLERTCIDYQPKAHKLPCGKAGNTDTACRLPAHKQLGHRCRLGRKSCSGRGLGMQTACRAASSIHLHHSTPN